MGEQFTIQSTVELYNGVNMPRFGFGAAEIASTIEEQKRIVATAIDAGYRLFDTASIYHTERGVGQAIKESGIDRDEFFISTKIWNGDARRGRKAIIRDFQESLERLEVDYVDALILHWPIQGKLVDTWRVMEDIYYSGRARALGLSNVKRYHHMEVMTNCEVMPHIQQDNFNPFYRNLYNRYFCQMNGIHFEAFGPLSRGYIFKDPVLQEIAQRYGKHPGQIILRWDLQSGVTTIPRSSNPKHIYANTEVFDFELTEEDMRKINALDTNYDENWDCENFNF